MPQTLDVSREGPFDAHASPMDTGDSPLVTTGLPGCPYRIASYSGPAVADTNPAFGMQLHHPRCLECIGAPESARLLYHVLSNLQILEILSQFVTSLYRMSYEMLALGMGRIVFPS